MKSASPAAFFTGDHRHCDELWAEIEAADSPDAALALWLEFDAAMRRHFAMEEEVLFPALESATGMGGRGPTSVMRSEHVQMRSLLDTMGKAAQAGQLEALLDQGDTLLMLIQQHNMKEEGMLYPLADGSLRAEWPGLCTKLESYPVG